MGTREATVVVMWHDALNGGDIERLVALSSDAVEIVGPRGVAQGALVLRDWAQRAGIRLEPLRMFARGDTAVVAEHAVWHAPETGDVLGHEDVATIVRVVAGRVAFIDRRPSLADALQRAGLSETDELPAGAIPTPHAPP